MVKIPNIDKDPSGYTFLIQTGLKALGLYTGTADNWEGDKTKAAAKAFAAEAEKQARGTEEPASFASENILVGDGTWKYTARIEGDDIVCGPISITCFGGWGSGIADPQDNGKTAFGKNTKNEEVDGVSIAMDSRYFPGMDRRDPPGYKALLGAPFPKIPAGTLVEVTIGDETYTPRDGIQDLGPGKNASRKATKPEEAHALDLTPIAAKHWKPGSSLRSLATTFEAVGSFRIIGGAKFVVPLPQTV